MPLFNQSEGVHMDECCRNCYLIKLVVKSSAIGLTVAAVWTMAIIGILSVIGA